LNLYFFPNLLNPNTERFIFTFSFHGNIDL
jgi:hypothetical protein